VMKYLFRPSILLLLTAGLLVCSRTDHSTNSLPPFSAESFHSICKEESGKIGKTTGGGSIILSSFNDTVRVIHANARYNCCADIKMEVKKTSYGFDILEKDEGFSCDCICDFDVTCLIYGLSDGSYLIKVFDVEGNFYYQGYVVVRSKKPDGPNG
jgi:hypothetical protein